MVLIKRPTILHFDTLDCWMELCRRISHSRKNGPPNINLILLKVVGQNKRYSPNGA